MCVRACTHTKCFSRGLLWKTEGKTSGRRDRTNLMCRKQQTCRYLGYTISYICTNVTKIWAVNINFRNYISPRNYKLTSARNYTKWTQRLFMWRCGRHRGIAWCKWNKQHTQEFLHFTLRRQFQMLFLVQKYKHNLLRYLLNCTAPLLRFSVLATYIRICTYLM